MKLLVYTGVFDGYDRVFPPMGATSDVDYVVITDDPALRVNGWRTHVLPTEAGVTGTLRNRYVKMLGHRVLPGYDASVYVDGNVRLLSSPKPLLQEALGSGAALGAFRHSRRSTVGEELEVCLQLGKVESAAAIRSELDTYLADGFPDRGGLVEATILLRNHAHPMLDEAMSLWWSLFQRHRNRDQISLPYVLWKTELPCQYFDWAFRDPNPYFGMYPHARGKDAAPFYLTLAARSYDSRVHRMLLDAVHAKWRLQRKARLLLQGKSTT